MPAQSKQQQKFMGIVRAIQKGEQPASKFSKKAQDAADDMKEKDVEKFASTKHKGLPKKVEQALREKIKSMVEDYVESCGYVVSAKDPNYKLKSPGGTGEEDRELKEEGFGSDEFLTKTEKKKFEKERLENAEVLGYTLTGTKDLKESINENRDFEKLYKLFSKKDYFGLKGVMKTQLGNYKRALKKGDKGAQKYSEKDVIDSVTRMVKNRAKFTYDELEKAIKKKDIKALKSKLRHDQRYSIAIFNQITGKKLPKNTRDIHSFLDNEFMNESINEMSAKSKKVINKLGKKEKEVFLTMVDMLGFDQVMSDYKRDKKAFKQALKDMTESVFAVRQDKIKNGERFPKEPNFDYDPEKGKSRIRKVNEGKGVDKIMKMADDYSYGKIAGKTVDVMTAKLFQAVYKKASQKARDRVDKMNEKQLYIFMMNLWKKFGKQLTLSS